MSENVDAMIVEAVKKTKAYNCLECGKCSAICPITTYDRTFSPRMVASKAITGSGALLEDDRIWTCLTCGRCYERCPSDVHYNEFIRMLRGAAAIEGHPGVCSHAGALQSFMRIMADPGKKMDRLGWVSDDLSVAKTGDVLFFVGCAPFFDTFFDELGVESLKGVRSAIRLLNATGTPPVLMEDERCCGHDLLWTGDEDSFRTLAGLNVERIRETGAKTIVTACPECYRTLAVVYPAFGFDHGLEVVHLSERLAEHFENSTPELRAVNRKITFQDPCRLGRHMGVYDAPRTVLDRIPGLELREMGRNRNMATCCGTNAWVNCDQNSKRIQLDHLREVKELGCDLLVTSCPKCEIHFRCAMSDRNLEEDVAVELMDFASLVEQSLTG